MDLSDATVRHQLTAALAGLGDYWAHAILYSLASVLLVQGLVRIWRVRSPRLATQLGFASLVLPPLALLLYAVLFGERGSIRDELVLIRLDGWMSLADGRRAWVVWVVVPIAFLTALPFAYEGLVALTSQWRAVGRPSANEALQRRAAEAARSIGAATGFVPRVVVLQRNEPAAWVHGLVRPVILLGEPLIDMLDREELEAVLAHECAHIVRRDAWLGYLSFVARTLLLFNPAVTYTYWQIAVHAEQDCDDIAIRWTGRPLALAAALVKVYQASHGRVPDLAEVVEDVRLSVRLWEAIARRTLLQERLGRILHPEHAQVGDGTAPRLVTACGAILALLFFVG